MKYIVTSEEKGKRVDQVAAEKFSITRSQIHKLLATLTVNGLETYKHYPVAEGDVIEMSAIVPAPAKKIIYFEPTIIGETDEILVINKPSGMVVHATDHHTAGTVVDWMLEKYPSVKSVGDDPLRPGIVHRLDKDASGVMVIAKTQNSFDSLKRQFKLRRTKKQYLIVVYGVVIPSEGVIDQPLARSKTRFTKIVGASEGRQSITHYWVEKTLGTSFSLVRVEPQSGRTHQIRVHFFSRGYPLVGDAIYVSDKIRKPLTARLMLHATSLEFLDTAGKPQKFECIPGAEFDEVLRRITD